MLDSRGRLLHRTCRWAHPTAPIAPPLPRAPKVTGGILLESGMQPRIRLLCLEDTNDQGNIKRRLAHHKLLSQKSMTPHPPVLRTTRDRLSCPMYGLPERFAIAVIQSGATRPFHAAVGKMPAVKTVTTYLYILPSPREVSRASQAIS